MSSATPNIGSLWRSNTTEKLIVFDLELLKNNYCYRINNAIEITCKDVLMFLKNTQISTLNLRYDTESDLIKEDYVISTVAVFLLETKVVYIFYDDYQNFWEEKCLRKL